jgi:hypothetical protein
VDGQTRATTAQAVPAETRPWAPWSIAVVLGLALGCAAYGADEISGLGDFTSSGFSWGLAALIMGYATPSARRAPITAATLLVSATVFYYLLILLVSRRWQGE